VEDDPVVVSIQPKLDVQTPTECLEFLELNFALWYYSSYNIVGVKALLVLPNLYNTDKKISLAWHA
jgi:hypothetical protein